MEDLAELNLLIDRAQLVAGSYYKLAKLVGLPEQRISDFRHGRRNASPEDCALFAAVAGLDPTQEMARAVLRKHAGTKKGDLLLKALGKPLLATGAAVASAGVHASAIFSMAPPDWTSVQLAIVTMCRKVKFFAFNVRASTA